jgi:hypothetical protein
MMAWIRTGTSLISFGFAIYKFFQLDLKVTGAQDNRPIGAREFALMMVGAGLLAVVLGTLDPLAQYATHPSAGSKPPSFYGWRGNSLHAVPRSGGTVRNHLPKIVEELFTNRGALYVPFSLIC